MRSYVISTDSSADLSEAYLKEHQITMISLSCILNGETYNSENPITPKQLYDNIREGAMPTTSQVNPEQAKAAFEPLLKEGKDILHLAFSSGLSGSCQSARIAAEELQDEYPAVSYTHLQKFVCNIQFYKLFHKNHVSGTGDGEPLCDSLNDSKKNYF